MPRDESSTAVTTYDVEKEKSNREEEVSKSDGEEVHDRKSSKTPKVQHSNSATL